MNSDVRDDLTVPLSTVTIPSRCGYGLGFTHKGDVIVGMGLHLFSETRSTKALPVLDQF
jgi:hypothetical protein